MLTRKEDPTILVWNSLLRRTYLTFTNCQRATASQTFKIWTLDKGASLIALFLTKNRGAMNATLFSTTNALSKLEARTVTIVVGGQRMREMRIVLIDLFLPVREC